MLQDFWSSEDIRLQQIPDPHQLSTGGSPGDLLDWSSSLLTAEATASVTVNLKSISAVASELTAVTVTTTIITSSTSAQSEESASRDGATSGLPSTVGSNPGVFVTTGMPVTTDGTSVSVSSLSLQLLSSIGPEPASTTSDTSSSNVPTEHPSDGISGPVIAAIVISIVVTFSLMTCLGLWYRSRARNKKRARELEKRAEWLDPAYVARVRQEMMGLDLSKITGTEDVSSLDHQQGHRRTVTELATWTADTANAAVDISAGWLNRGETLGSLRAQSRSTSTFNARPTPRIRTTADGSPILLPTSTSFHRHSLSSDDFVHHSPLEGEWLSNNSLTALTSPSLSLPTTQPPPPFDPRGSMRESQIGLALPFPSLPPPQSHTADTLIAGNLTGDGYENMWRVHRLRSSSRTSIAQMQMQDAGGRSGKVVDVNGRVVRMPLEGSDDPEAEESFLSAGSNGATTVVESGSENSASAASQTELLRRSRAYGADETAGEAQPSQVQVDERKRDEAQHVGQLDPRGAGRRWGVLRGREEVMASQTPHGSGGDEEAVRELLREKLGLVRAVFGRG